MTTLILFTITRFVHVMTAIVLVGGTAFLRFVLQPAAAATLPQEEHDKLRAKVMERWKSVVHRGIGLLLISGAINYGRGIYAGTHKGDALYHALLGTKIILALAVFFIASVLVGRSPRFESWRKNARKWLLINIALATLIVGISGFLRVRAARQDQDAKAAVSAAAESATS